MATVVGKFLGPGCSVEALFKILFLPQRTQSSLRMNRLSFAVCAGLRIAVCAVRLQASSYNMA